MRGSPRKAAARPLPYDADSRLEGAGSRAQGGMIPVVDAMDSESDGGVSSDSDMEDDSDDTDMDSNDSESSDDDATTGYMYHSDRLQERLAGRMVWRRRIEESDDEEFLYPDPGRL